MGRTIATNTHVSRSELVEFLSGRHRALVITTRADGRPQASPVASGVDAQGRIVISTYPERAKTRNARRDSRVTGSGLSTSGHRFADGMSVRSRTRCPGISDGFMGLDCQGPGLRSTCKRHRPTVRCAAARFTDA